MKEMLFGAVPETSTEYVDLGEAGIWAKCNVGAISPEECGTYFSWGNIEGVTMVGNTNSVNVSIEQVVESLNNVFGPDGMTFTVEGLEQELQQIGMSIDGFTAYITNYSFDQENYAKTAGGGLSTGSTFDSKYDAATANMDGTVEVSGVTKTWRMPTINEFQKLITNTTQTGDTVNGVSGMRFTSKTNENSIFIPFAGSCIDSLLVDEGLGGLVWSSSDAEETIALCLRVHSSGASSSNGFARFGGMPVRAVLA